MGHSPDEFLRLNDAWPKNKGRHFAAERDWANR
jgi:hypothetical protein